MVDTMTDEEIRREITNVPEWYHRIELRPGIVTPGVNDSQLQLRNLDLPADCSGLRVLDLGARDGFFAFEMEKRGADVLAVDNVAADLTGFAVASRLLGSRVRFLHEDLYRLDERAIGTFDIVLFLGLLYHLPDPLGALRLIRRLCRTRLYVETVVIDQVLQLDDGSEVSLADLDPRLVSIPIMRFFPGASLNADATNFWAANIRCVKDMLADSGFSVVRVSPLRRRAAFECITATEGRSAP